LGAGVARPPDRLRPRDVLVTQRPLNRFAPLLWQAAALVTAGGGPAAHLLEVARSIGVPAVTGCRLDALSDGVADGVADHLVAVDGDRGTVSIAASTAETR
ncbi:MAG: PEP-utilizing enzyme, partial [Actinomycetota bacterium]